MVFAGRRAVLLTFLLGLALANMMDRAALAADNNAIAGQLDHAPVLERQVDQADQGTGKIKVFLDQAKIVKLPERTATLVVGNPVIADVALQAGGVLVVTGKGYGVTNLVALDRAGVVLAERPIEVSSARGSLVAVFRGIERETYNCAPDCERRITLGDSATYFTTTLTQAGTLSLQAQGGAGAR